MPDGSSPRPARAPRRLTPSAPTPGPLPALKLAIGDGSVPLSLELVGLVLAGMLGRYTPRDLVATSLLRSIAEAFVAALLPGVSAPRPMELARALGLRLFVAPRDSMAGGGDRSAWSCDDDDSLDLLVADDLSPTEKHHEVVHALAVAVLVKVGMPPALVKSAGPDRSFELYRAIVALAGFLLVPRALVDELLPPEAGLHVASPAWDAAYAAMRARTQCGCELLAETLDAHLALRCGHQLWHLTELDLEAA